jgi:hypothetical protein
MDAPTTIQSINTPASPWGERIFFYASEVVLLRFQHLCEAMSDSEAWLCAHSTEADATR